MPNLVGRLTLREIDGHLDSMGSCVVVTFDKMTVQQASTLRNRFRDEGITLMVVKNRLAMHALAARGMELNERLLGKCGLAFAPEEKAITAAKLVREFQKENRDIQVKTLAGVIEGEVIEGQGAAMIADMADKDTVRAQIATAISGPARSLATVLQAVGAGVAQCLKQRSEQEGEQEGEKEG